MANLAGKRRIKSLGTGSVNITLYLPRVTRKHRLIGRAWNTVVSLCWLPVVLYGIYILLNRDYKEVSGDFRFMVGLVIGAFLGLFIHELSHAAACIGYGGNWFEMGVTVRCFLPGAYVLLERDNIRNRFRRAQVSAAGIEGNFLLSGLFLILLKAEILPSELLILAAMSNLILAVFNISLINGLDGYSVFSEFLGVKDFVEKAKKVVLYREARQIVKNQGIHGRATIMACYIIVVFQSMLPIVLILNIVNIAELFMLFI